MLATELLIDFFFMADIVLNLNTGYIIEQVHLFWLSRPGVCWQAPL